MVHVVKQTMRIRIQMAPCLTGPKPVESAQQASSQAGVTEQRIATWRTVRKQERISLARCGRHPLL